MTGNHGDANYPELESKRKEIADKLSRVREEFKKARGNKKRLELLCHEIALEKQEGMLKHAVEDPNQTGIYAVVVKFTKECAVVTRYDPNDDQERMSAIQYIDELVFDIKANDVDTPWDKEVRVLDSQRHPRKDSQR